MRVTTYESPYSKRQLNCKGRACAKCGECRDWCWRPGGQYRKKYTKRGDATCCIDGRRRIDGTDRDEDRYGCEDGGNGGSRVYLDGRFYYHVGHRPHGSYGSGRLCACDDNLS